VPITKVIIPAQNEKDLEEIPKDIREKMEFFPVKDMDEVVKIAFPKTVAEKKPVAEKTTKAAVKLSRSSD
jgi:ATP-dependent Lon protease